MKIYRLAQLAELTQDKKVELGKEELGAKSIGLRYQTLSIKEHAVIEKSSGGKEEIIYVVKGTLQVAVKKSLFSVSAGDAFYTDKEVVLENRTNTEAAFITASTVAPIEGLASGNRVETQPEKLKTDKDDSTPDNTKTVPKAYSEIFKNEMADFIISDTEPRQEPEPLEERQNGNNTALITEQRPYTISKREDYR